MRLTPQAVKYVIYVQNMDRAVEFYRDILGFTESYLSPYWSELQFGNAIVGLHGCGDGSRRETGLSVQYEDVASAYQLALAAGATEVQAPVQREGEPIILGILADPEGNEIMLTQFVG